MSKSKAGKNEGKLTESQIPNPTQAAELKIKGTFSASCEISRAGGYELVLDRCRLYVNGKHFEDNVISASASDKFFAFVTRNGRIRIINDKNNKNKENSNITASAVIAHPQKPLIWYTSPAGRIFEASIKEVQAELPAFTFNEAGGSILCESYDTNYCWDDYSIYDYNRTYYFDCNKLSARDCALHYFKQTPEYSELLKKSKITESAENDKLILSRIRINSFSSEERSDCRIINQSYSCDDSHTDHYKDYKVSFTVVDLTESLWEISAVKKLCDGIPEGYCSFYDYIYNEYL